MEDLIDDQWKELEALKRDCEHGSGFPRGASPLGIVAGRGLYHVAEILLADGYDPNDEITAFFTPLMNAVDCDDVKMARLLLIHGARAEDGSNHEISSLQRAIKKGNRTMADMLVDFVACLDNIYHTVHVLESFGNFEEFLRSHGKDPSEWTIFYKSQTDEQIDSEVEAVVRSHPKGILRHEIKQILEKIDPEDIEQSLDRLYESRKISRAFGAFSRIYPW